MHKLLLSLALLLGLAAPAAAQTGCGGVNFTPAPGVSCLLEPTNPTYAATSIGLVPAASATDIACLQGAVGKVIRLQAIRISGSAGTAVSAPIYLLKRIALDTGGTPATSTALPAAYSLDSSNAPALASLNAWTANPTINDSSPGYIDSANLALTTTSALTGVQPFTIFDYQERNFEQAPILRTATQAVCLNLQSLSISSGVLQISWKWTELAQ